MVVGVTKRQMVARVLAGDWALPADQPSAASPAAAREPHTEALTAAPATGLRPVAAQQKGSDFNRRDGGPFSTGLDTRSSRPRSFASQSAC